MKKILLFVLFSISLVSAKDTTANKLQQKNTVATISEKTKMVPSTTSLDAKTKTVKDTVLVKVVDAKDTTLTTVMTFFLSIIVSMFVLYVTIKHQSKINNKLIDVATRRKLIDDLTTLIADIECNLLFVQVEFSKLVDDMPTSTPMITTPPTTKKSAYHGLVIKVADDCVEIYRLLFRIRTIISINRKDNKQLNILYLKALNSNRKYLNMFKDEQYIKHTDCKKLFQKMDNVVTKRYERFIIELKKIIEIEQADINKQL